MKKKSFKAKKIFLYTALPKRNNFTDFKSISIPASKTKQAKHRSINKEKYLKRYILKMKPLKNILQPKKYAFPRKSNDPSSLTKCSTTSCVHNVGPFYKEAYGLICC